MARGMVHGGVPRFLRARGRGMGAVVWRGRGGSQLAERHPAAGRKKFIPPAETEEQSCSSPRTPRRTRTLASGKALPPPACPLLHARHARRSAPCPQAHAQPKASCLGAGASALALAMRLRGPLHPRDPPMAGHRCLHGGHLATFYSTPTAPRGVHRPASPHSILDSAARRDEDFSLVDPRAHSRCG